MIHVIGDSHVSVFTGLHGVCPCYNEVSARALPGFREWHIGPYLAFSVSRPRHEGARRVRECLDQISTTDRVIFCFGEIDCRNHIVKHSKKGGVAAAAGALARRYATASILMAGGRRVAFMAVPPPTVARHGNNIQPTIGTFSQRLRAMRGFNRGLQAAATALGADLIDVNARLANSRGEPREAYFADGVHADPRALPCILAELVRLGWLSTTSDTLVAAAALAKVDPPASVSLPGGLGHTGAARQVLVDLAMMRCRAMGAQRVAIMGAGRHTRELGLGPFERAGLKVDVILDDLPLEAEMFGVPVERPSLLGHRVDAVVVSSDACEDVLRDRAVKVFGASMPIITIYAWREAEMQRAQPSLKRERQRPVIRSAKPRTGVATKPTARVSRST